MPNQSNNEEEIRTRACGCYDWRGGKIEGSKCNNRSSLPETAIQHSRGKEEDWQVESLHWLHKPQLGLSERLISCPKDWSTGRFHFGSCPDEFPGCILRLLPSSNARARSRKNCIHHPRGVFCYKVMPFGLKNTRAIYQRIITKMIEAIMGKSMDAYIDDMVVKSKRVSDHVRDLTEVFIMLRKHKLRLNTTKCAFGWAKKYSWDTWWQVEGSR